MSTDITLESAKGRQPVDFDAWASGELDQLARAVASIAAGADVTNAVAEATEATHRSWRQVGFDREPSRFFLGVAVSHLHWLDPTTDGERFERTIDQLPMRDRAVVIGVLGLDWPYPTSPWRLISRLLKPGMRSNAA